jgi:hypothetical protein
MACAPAADKCARFHTSFHSEDPPNRGPLRHCGAGTGCTVTGWLGDADSNLRVAESIRTHGKLSRLSDLQHLNWCFLNSRPTDDKPSAGKPDGSQGAIDSATRRFESTSPSQSAAAHLAFSAMRRRASENAASSGPLQRHSLWAAGLETVNQGDGSPSGTAVSVAVDALSERDCWRSRAALRPDRGSCRSGFINRTS